MNGNLKTIILLFFLGIFMLSAYPSYNKTMDEVDRTITLRKEDKGTRSESGTTVVAYIRNDIITLEVSNYTGNSTLVEVFNAEGIVQASSQFDNSNYALLDISSLSAGQYEIVVTLDYRYIGSFEM